MHKIQAKEFTLDDFSCEHLFDFPAYPYDEAVMFGDGDITEDNHLTAIDVNGNTCYYTPKGFMNMTCQVLNHFRKLYLQTNDKKYWWQMIQLLPSSYNQRRTVQLNYEVLSHIYFDRKDHKLDEWHTLCDMIRQLPYAKELITREEDTNSVDIKTSNIKFMEDGSVVIAGTKYVLEEKVKALENHIDTLVSIDD